MMTFAFGRNWMQSLNLMSGAGGGGGGGGGGAGTRRLRSTLSEGCSVEVSSATCSAPPVSSARQVKNRASSSTAATEPTIHTGTRSRLTLLASACPCQRGDRSRMIFGFTRRSSS